MIRAEMDTVRFDLIKQNYPAGLTEAKVWGVFLCRYKCDAEGNVTGKIGKLPLRFNGTEIVRNNAGEPVGASSKDTSLLVTLDEAVARCEANDDLIGIDGDELSLIVPAWLITEDSEYGVIDGDNILDDNGDFKTEAIKRIFTDGNAGVSEYSISLTGAHRIVHIGDAAWNEAKDYTVDGENFEVFAKTRRWMTATGLLVEDAELDPTIESYDQFEGLVACMRPLKKAVSNPFEGVTVSTEPAPVRGTVEGYVKSIKANTRFNEGNRNEGMFGVAGNVAKKVGFDFSQTLSIMRDLNQSICDPSLDDAELRTLVDSSLKNGTPRVDNAPAVLEFDMSMIANKVAEATVAGEREAPEEEEPVKVKLELKKFDYSRLLDIEGVFGTYMDQLSDGPNDPKLPTVTAGCIAYMSTLCAGNIEAEQTDEVGGGTYNHMVGVTASSGSGKDAGRKANDRLVKSLGLGYLKSGPIKINSGAGFWRTLASPAYEHPLNDQRDTKIEIGQGGCKLFMCDEAGDIFDESRKVNANTASICEALKVMFTSSGSTMFQPSSYADATNNVTIEYLCPTVLFTTTPDRMYSRFPMEFVGDGFLGRLILIDQPYIKAKRRRSINPTALPIRKLEMIKAMSEPFAATGDPSMMRYVQYDDDATQLYLDYAYAIEKEIENLHLHNIEGVFVNDHQFAPLWARAMEKANRLVGLLACSECNGFDNVVVTKRLMQIAIDFALWNTHEMQEKVRNCIHPDKQSEILSRIISLLRNKEEDGFEGMIESKIRNNLKAPVEECSKALRLGLEDNVLVRIQSKKPRVQDRFITVEYAKKIGVQIDE